MQICNHFYILNSFNHCKECSFVNSSEGHAISDSSSLTEDEGFGKYCMLNGKKTNRLSALYEWLSKQTGHHQEDFAVEKYNQNWSRVRSLLTHDPKRLKAELATLQQ